MVVDGAGQVQEVEDVAELLGSVLEGGNFAFESLDDVVEGEGVVAQLLPCLGVVGQLGIFVEQRGVELGKRLRIVLRHFLLVFLVPLVDTGGIAPELDVAEHKALHHLEGGLGGFGVLGGEGEFQLELANVAVVVEGVVVHVSVEQGDAAGHAVVAGGEHGVVALDEAEEVGHEVLGPGVAQLFRQQLLVDVERHIHHALLVFKRQLLVKPEVVDGDVGQGFHHLGAVRHGVVVFGEELHHALVEPPLFFGKPHEPLVFSGDFIFDIGVAQVDL